MANEEKENQKPEPKKELVSVVNSESSAAAFFKQSKHNAPEGIAFVTSDLNIFWDEKAGHSHAFKNKLQIFKIKV